MRGVLVRGKRERNWSERRGNGDERWCFFCLETQGLTLASTLVTCEDILVRRQTGSG